MCHLRTSAQAFCHVTFEYCCLLLMQNVLPALVCGFPLTLKGYFRELGYDILGSYPNTTQLHSTSRKYTRHTRTRGKRTNNPMS